MDIGANFKISAGVVGQAAVDRLNDSVGKLGGLAKTTGLALAGIGAGLSFAVFKEKFDGVVETILQVKDAAEKTGSTVEKMGGIFRAAKITGDDWGTIEGAIIKMDKALAGADDTAKGASYALSKIGLNIADLRKMDPADSFTAIAMAMDGFEDSAGKTALAMDLFGKSGAQVLPFLKDYAELGTQVSTVTKQQAEDAEAYQRATLRLNAAKNELYKTVSTKILPVATDLLGALTDVETGTDGVKGAAKRLAEDGSMTGAFQEAARAAAALMDVLSWVTRGIAQVGESFGVVWNDIKTGAKLATLGIGAGFTEEGRKAMAGVIAERDAYMAKVGKDFDMRWSGATPYSDALEARFARRSQGAGGGRGGDAFSEDDPRRLDRKRSLTGYTSRAPSEPKGGGGGGGADSYTSELQSLGREAAKLKWQTEHIQQYAEKITSAKEAQVQFDIEQGKFKDLSTAQKQALLEAARQVDQYAVSMKAAQAGLDYDKETQNILDNTRALGMSSLEKEKFLALQDLENKGIKEGTVLYEELSRKRLEALQKANDAQRSFTVGIQQGFNEYLQTAGDAASSAKNMMTNAFQGMEDALVSFVMTGKLSFKDLARSILADLTRMIVKQMLFNALSGFMGAFGGGAGGGVFGGMNGMAGGGGITMMAANGAAFNEGLQAFAKGGVVDSPTLFKFAKGGAMRNGLMGEAGPEAIMPLTRDSAGRLGVRAQGGRGGDINIAVSVDVQSGRTTGTANDGTYDRLGTAIAGAVRQEIITQQRPGGLLYK